MKKTFTNSIIFSLFFISVSNAQVIFDNTKYVQVLYRINVGGEPQPSHDNTGIDWITDSFTDPSSYSDIETYGNKVYTTKDPVTIDPSVPAGTPVALYADERSIEGWDTRSMNWNFLVEAGKFVEIRLYLADIYFLNHAERIFDIHLNGVEVESDLDVVATYGHDVGIMRSYEFVSDGNVELTLTASQGQPAISGIEILELHQIEATGTISASYDHKAVYPNPFSDHLYFETSSGLEVTLLDIAGGVVKNSDDAVAVNNGFKFLCSELPKGVYFLKTAEKTIRVLKD